MNSLGTHNGIFYTGNSVGITFLGISCIFYQNANALSSIFSCSFIVTVAHSCSPFLRTYKVIQLYYGTQNELFKILKN